jgi:hypothetical protein
MNYKFIDYIVLFIFGAGLLIILGWLGDFALILWALMVSLWSLIFKTKDDDEQ